MVKIYRCATVVRGGRRFSFGAMVVVGDGAGRVGVGYGKANEVPPAVDKARKLARDAMVNINLAGGTIPHRVMGTFGASKVALVPAGPGTGVIAGASVRAVLELAGVKDVLTKAYGSLSPKNLVKATLEGLRQLRTREMVEELRGVSIPTDEVQKRLARHEARVEIREPEPGMAAPTPPVATAEMAPPTPAETPVVPAEAADAPAADTAEGETPAGDESSTP